MALISLPRAGSSRLCVCHAVLLAPYSLTLHMLLSSSVAPVALSPYPILLQNRSMRKTRLLLDAVQAAGRKGVTFAALDLCEHSLREALTALQGEVDSGLVILLVLRRHTEWHVA